jgi:hypothetical protein
MSLPELDNLVSIGRPKTEPRNDAEVGRILAMARVRLADAQLASLSAEGRFSSAYNAAHARHWQRFGGMATAAKAYTVFQCLAHTLGWPAHRWRVLDAAHRKRNLAEYEGLVEFEESAIEELRVLAAALIADVARMTGM